MATFKELDNIYSNVNTIIDELLFICVSIDKNEKQKQNLHLQIGELEKQLTNINILRLNKIKKLK